MAIPFDKARPGPALPAAELVAAIREGRPVRLEGAVIEGDVDLDGIQIDGDLDLEIARVNGDLFCQALESARSEVRVAVRMAGLTVGGHVVALRCHFPMLLFLGEPNYVPSPRVIPALGLRYDSYALLISAVSWVLVPLFLAGLTGIVRQRQ